MQKQRVLIIIKPDAVQRGLIGKVLRRFEQVGLTIVALKFEWATDEKAAQHYPDSIEWFTKVGERTINNYKKKGLDTKQIIGLDDPVAIGRMVKKWLIAFLQEAPVLLAVLEGYEAVHIVRKLCGDTNPMHALPGTIRGDFSHDNLDLANEKKRPLRNIIHATDNVEEATKEINNWFTSDEIYTYPRADEEAMF